MFFTGKCRAFDVARNRLMFYSMGDLILMWNFWGAEDSYVRNVGVVL